MALPAPKFVGTLGLPFFVYRPLVERLAQDIGFACLGTCDRSGIRVVAPLPKQDRLITAALMALSYALEHAKIGILEVGQDPGHG